ncbi:MAG: hypothetical protein DMF19_07340 [Verrucomicrobia bacterium]|nr:MAG: hypothetical protein DMF19_07340 [Verrucomicrobiota bacterium]
MFVPRKTNKTWQGPLELFGLFGAACYLRGLTTSDRQILCAGTIQRFNNFGLFLDWIKDHRSAANPSSGGSSEYASPVRQLDELVPRRARTETSLTVLFSRIE